jgi:hypothetical protein
MAIMSKGKWLMVNDWIWIAMSSGQVLKNANTINKTIKDMG